MNNETYFKVLESLESGLGIDLSCCEGLLDSSNGIKLNPEIAKKVFAEVYNKTKEKVTKMDGAIDKLRDFQIDMLKKLSKVNLNQASGGLIPYYLKQANIILFYDLKSRNLAIFFPEKHKKNFSNGKPVRADIVKVSINVDKSVKNEGFYSALHDFKLDYLYFSEHFRNTAHTKSISDCAEGFVSREHMEQIKKDNNLELFTCVLDENDQPAYLVTDVNWVNTRDTGLSKKLKNDLAIAYYYHLLPLNESPVDPNYKFLFGTPKEKAILEEFIFNCINSRGHLY